MSSKSSKKLNINNRVDMLHNQIISKLQLLKSTCKLLIQMYNVISAHKKASALVSQHHIVLFNRILSEVRATKKHYILRCSPHLFVIRSRASSAASSAISKRGATSSATNSANTRPAGTSKPTDKRISSGRISMLNIQFDFSTLDFSLPSDAIDAPADTHPVFDEPRYVCALRTESVNNKIDAIVHALDEPVALSTQIFKRVYSRTKPQQLEFINQIHETFARAQRNVINIENIDANDDHEACSKCAVKMQFYHDLSEFRCPQCGIIEPYAGGITYDIANSEKAKTTNNSHRHFLYWITHIQGCENMQITDEELNLIKSRLPNKRRITYKIMRACLKDTKLTKFNANIPSLMYKLTKVEPVRLTSTELQDIEQKFDIITKIYDSDVKSGDRRNRPFNPYIIYKICEQKFANAPAKRRILDYIHIQSADTVIRLDQTFQKICAKLPTELGIKYKPTNYVR